MRCVKWVVALANAMSDLFVVEIPHRLLWQSVAVSEYRSPVAPQNNVCEGLEPPCNRITAYRC